MKGISPLIGAIMLISLILVLAAALSPWITKLVQDSQNQTGTRVDKEIYCRDMSYDFVSSYGSGGVTWDFSTGSDTLTVRIKNYGTNNVYDLSFEFELVDYSLVRFDATLDTQRSMVNPIRPQESAIIEANITQDLTQNLRKVTVRNGMDCTPVSMEV